MTGNDFRGAGPDMEFTNYFAATITANLFKTATTIDAGAPDWGGAFTTYFKADDTNIIYP